MEVDKEKLLAEFVALKLKGKFRKLAFDLNDYIQYYDDKIPLNEDTYIFYHVKRVSYLHKKLGIYYQKRVDGRWIGSEIKFLCEVEDE